MKTAAQKLTEIAQKIYAEADKIKNNEAKTLEGAAKIMKAWPDCPHLYDAIQEEARVRVLRRG